MTTTDPRLDALQSDHVASIASDVWQSFLSEELVEHPLGPDAPPLTGLVMTGAVSVSGGWEGSVFVSCSAEQARGAAEAMFMADPGSLSDEEVSDGLGELTNMIGGNIKSLLPGPSTLSLPSVAQGEGYTVRVPGAVLLHRVALVSAAGPVYITVWKA